MNYILQNTENTKLTSSFYEYIFVNVVENYSDDIKTHISFYNQFHYGDNLFNLKFFYNISQYLLNRSSWIYAVPTRPSLNDACESSAPVGK